MTQSWLLSNETNNLPLLLTTQPVMSIWTPKALEILQENASKGKSGPCFTAKQIWKEMTSKLDHGGLREGFGLVRPSKEEWVRDADTPEEWESMFGSLPRATA